jgi:hypothetical protein
LLPDARDFLSSVQSAARDIETANTMRELVRIDSMLERLERRSALSPKTPGGDVQAEPRASK